MKKFIIYSLMALTALLAVFLPTQSATAQTSLISTGNGLAKDTVTNTGVKTLVKQVTGFKETVVIVATLTKISGTLGGKLVPIASVDGSTYIDVSLVSRDTLTAADVTSQSKGYAMPKGYQYYGVQWTGTGTMSGSFTGKLLARKSTD